MKNTKAKPMKTKSAAQKAVSFIGRSTPPEREPTAIEAHNAANPEMRELRESSIGKFIELFNQMCAGLDDVLRGLIVKAETARQAGIYLKEFADTLPGKRLTPDFYEQCKALFCDGRGQTIPYATIVSLIRNAEKHPAPIVAMKEALEVRQLLFEVSGEPEFQLAGEPVVKTRIPPPDEFGRVSNFIEKPDLDEFVNSWQALKQNPNYFPGGHIRPDLRETYVHEWRPKLEKIAPVLAEIRAELGI